MLLSESSSLFCFCFLFFYFVPCMNKTEVSTESWMILVLPVSHHSAGMSHDIMKELNIKVDTSQTKIP